MTHHVLSALRKVLYRAESSPSGNAFPVVAEFSGAGARRSEADIEVSVASRNKDQKTAERLSSAGFSPYRPDSRIFAIDLASEGELFSDHGRELVRLNVFDKDVRREQRHSSRLLSAWVMAGGRRDIVHIRARRSDAVVGIEDLRDHHRKSASDISQKLYYFSRANRWFRPVAYAVHHRPIDGGALIDVHFHIAVEVCAGRDDDRLIRYLSRSGYDVYISDRELTGSPSEGAELLSYLRNGASRHVDEFTDENLVGYVKAVYCGSPLHRYQTLGEFRKFCGEMTAANVTVGEDAAGAIVLTRKPARPKYLPGFDHHPDGPRLLRIKLAWFGVELRPAAIVRNWTGSWHEFEQRYDLRHICGLARDALLSIPADTPEFPWCTDGNGNSIPPPIQ